MDYGHTSQSDGAFFTAGAGTSPEGLGDAGANNLDLSNKSIEWGQNANLERDSRNLGRSANRLPDHTENIGEGSQNSEPQLGEVVDLSMPPGAESLNLEDPDVPAEASFDKNAIRTSEKLSPSAIKEVDMAIAKLNQDGNIADFYNTARDAMEANLDNSYNRKLAS